MEAEVALVEDSPVVAGMNEDVVVVGSGREVRLLEDAVISEERPGAVAEITGD